MQSHFRDSALVHEHLGDAESLTDAGVGNSVGDV